MIVKRKGITDKSHLVKTIREFSSVKNLSELMVEQMIDTHLEFAEEISKDGVLSGYALVFNFFGIRSFHGYKLTEGYGVRAFRIAREMIERFNVKKITTTIDQLKTIRIAKLLGFSCEQQLGDILVMGRG